MKSFIFCYTVVSHEFEFIILLGLYLIVHKCHVNKLLNFFMGLYTVCTPCPSWWYHTGLVSKVRHYSRTGRCTHTRQDFPSSWRMLVGTRCPGAATEDAGRQQGLAGRPARCVALSLVMDAADPPCPSRALCFNWCHSHFLGCVLGASRT